MHLTSEQVEQTTVPILDTSGNVVGNRTTVRCRECDATREFRNNPGLAAGWAARHCGMDDDSPLDHVCPARMEDAAVRRGRKRRQSYTAPHNIYRAEARLNARS